ncbi:MAG: PilZ domain-containing protein [Leptospiraceae bacterium]|nr:PilZ domain-containing protein [Leptospiraceae bacterium]
MSINYLDRRKRARIPKPVLFVGLVCIAYPFLNYYNLTSYYSLPLSGFSILWSELNIVQKFLLFLPLVSGVGILLIQKFGYYSFLLNAGLLIFFNLYAIFRYPIARNWFSLIEVIIVSSICIYLLRKDISIPFLNQFSRGFRRARRKPVQIPIRIFILDDSLTFTTINLSYRGFSVSWENCPLEINSETKVQFSILEKKFDQSVGVVRKEGTLVAFAFRGLSSELKKSVKKFIRSKQ